LTRLLVTGFGPFPRMPRNPSAEIAARVAAAPRLRLHGIEATAVVLTTAYATLARELDPLLAAEPNVVLLLGVAGRASKARVEERATARRSILFPDVLGDTPTASGIGHPPASARRTSVNRAAVLRALRARGVAARHSRDAGRYLCNAAYFRALARRGPTLFVHMPRVPRGRPTRDGACRRVGPGWRAALVAALVDIAISMARHGRSVVRPPSFR
jgi:pyroglutamyl-peptidase